MVNFVSERTADSRDRIFKSTLAEIYTNGVLGLRIANVAENAKVSVALVFKYYGNRNSLISEVIATVIEEQFAADTENLSKILANAGDSEVFDRALAALAKPEDPWRYQNRWLRIEAKAASVYVPELRNRISTAISSGIRANTELIEQARARSGNTSQVPAHVISWMLFSLTDGFTNNDLSEKPMTNQEYVLLLQELLKTHIG